MKQIRPVQQYEGCDYPAAEPKGADRRGVLRTLLAGAAAFGSATALGAEGATRTMGGPPVYRYRAQIDFPKGYKYANCRKVIRALVVATWDSRLAFYLNKKAERARILKAVYAVLARHKCVDVTDRGRRSRLTSKIGRALVALYTKRTKHKASEPAVWLLFRATQKTCGDPVGPTLGETPPSR